MKNSFLPLGFLLTPCFVFAQLTANFSFEFTNCQGLNLAFTDLSTDGTITDWLWDFGDGNNSTLQDPTHTYAGTGTYNVCLTVTETGGGIYMFCTSVEAVSQDVSTSETYVGCEGDGYSISVNGVVYDPSNPIGTETMTAANGCDSIVTINLIYYEISTEEVNHTGCAGDDSGVFVNGNWYWEGNPTGAEYMTNANGCDSVITVNAVYNNILSGEELYYGNCGDGYSVGVNGTTYDENNHMGEEILTSSFGCDSIVTIFLDFGNQFTESYDGCSGDGYSITINGTTYNEANPTGVETFPGSLCDTILSIELTFSTLQMGGQSITHPTCNSMSDGGVSIYYLLEGTSPYNKDWNTGSTGHLTNVTAGMYTVTITDAVGCTLVQSYELEETTPLEINTNPSAVACDGEGQIDLTVTAGLAPFTYLWSTGATTPYVDNLIAGEYTVEVTDDNGCIVSETDTIGSTFKFDLSSTFAECDSTNGMATAAISNGGPGTYLWSNGNAGPQQNDLAPGWYSVTVTDSTNLCQAHQNIEVLEDTICYVRIGGYVYIDDVNPDCQKDSTTIGAHYVMVTLSDGQITFTDLNGHYEFIVPDAGTYSISIGGFNETIYEGLCAANLSLDALTYGQLYTNNNFYLKYYSLHDIEVKVSKNAARPGFNHIVNICVMNKGTTPESGTITFIHSDILEFNWSNPDAGNYDAGTQTLNWAFNNIPPGAVYVYQNSFLVPVSTPFGTTLTYQFFTDSIPDDITPENNVNNCTLNVTGSYDPNDKQADPLGIGPDGDISKADTTFTYRIRFQNTGTDTAFTVLIRDTLASCFDISSIEPGASSHAYTATIRDGNVLELLFENILLVDSVANEPESHGFVFFDIELLPDLPYGTIIENQAGIYFDFNVPVITNTATNTISKHKASISGYLQTETGLGIGEVLVELMGGDTNAIQIVSEEYSFEDIPTESSYTIGPTRDDNPLNGVSSFDLVLMTKHILGAPLDSPYKIIAADINKSGSVSTLDILELRKVILLINDTFPENDSWRFIAEDYIFPNPGNPFSSLFPEDIWIPDFMDNHLNADFIGVKIGDVNNSVVPALAAATVKTAVDDQLTFAIQNGELKKGKEYKLVLRAHDFKDMVGFQFTLAFETKDLEFTGLEKGTLHSFDDNNVGLTAMDEGRLNFSWNGLKTTLPDASPLINLRFRAKRNTQWSKVIHLGQSEQFSNKRILQKEAYQETAAAFNLLDVKLLFDNSITKQKASDQLVVYPNRPNPFKQETTIPFYLPEETEVTIMVSDVNGKILKQHQATYNRGYNEFSVIAGKEFQANGVYYYQVKTAEQSFIGKMVMML